MCMVQAAKDYIHGLESVDSDGGIMTMMVCF